MAGLGDYSEKVKGERGYKMKGFSGFKQRTDGPVKTKSMMEVEPDPDIGYSDETPEHYKLHFGKRAKQQFDFRDSRPDKDNV